ncbi:MAG: RtcB family protein [Chloroflexi bacterium]|nr:RtcB family protein [Chloroflexota bacterium]
MSEKWEGPVRKIDDYHWEIPVSYKAGMRVPGLVFADEHMLRSIRQDQALDQVANVAFLPGIVRYSMAMPDIHWGYGFPVGGVAATRVDDGVISPGGIGFDINCGVRLLRTGLNAEEVRPKLELLTAELFHNIPSGVGSEGKIRLREKEIDKVLAQGAQWAVALGYGVPEDIESTEERGRLDGADPDRVSEKAKKRGIPQLGTLGSGNHFLEVEEVDEIYDEVAARTFGIDHLGQVVVFVHTGSRGLGYQICDDYLRVMAQAVQKYGISLPDRQLACAPFKSPEGQDYLAAMRGGANFAWANRQCITHWIRDSFSRVFGKGPQQLGMEVVYDVAHNVAKVEEYEVDGRRQTLCIHRKGATRAFPPGHRDVPAKYREVGQPVLVPGDMGRYSYLAVGTEKAMTDSFGSTCHGAGRVQSRTAAKRSLKGVDIAHELASRGILVRAAARSILAEEASEAYKDVMEVVEITHKAGISRKVARMKPMGVVKG